MQGGQTKPLKLLYEIFFTHGRPNEMAGSASNVIAENIKSHNLYKQVSIETGCGYFAKHLKIAAEA